MHLRPASSRLLGLAVVLLLASTSAIRASLGDENPPGKSAPLDPDAQPAKDRLAMTPAVVCKSIDARGNYEVLPDAAMTADEKLLVYFCPQNYRVELSGGTYRIELSQDGQIRRQGQKEVLRRKEKLLEYRYSDASAPNPIYLKNAVSLKGLKPGEYEFDITLHDKLGKGPAATQTIGFRVVPAVLPKAEAESEPEDADPPKAKPRPRSKRRPRRSAAARPGF